MVAEFAECAIPFVANNQSIKFYNAAMQEWGKRFRAHMQLHRLSQESLAESLGRTQGAIGHWIRGERQINLSEFWKLCEAAGADPKLILFGQDETGLVSGIRQVLTAHPELIPGYGDLEKKLRRKKPRKTTTKHHQ